MSPVLINEYFMREVSSENRLEFDAPVIRFEPKNVNAISDELTESNCIVHIELDLLQVMLREVKHVIHQEH